MEACAWVGLAVLWTGGVLGLLAPGDWRPQVVGLCGIALAVSMSVGVVLRRVLR